MADHELRSVDLTNGVNEHGNGFVTVAASSRDGTILIGQLTPDEVRKMALQWLEVAEAADQDAAVLRTTRKLGIDDNLAALLVLELRKSRSH